MPSTMPVPAAQYLRMSTERQHYSLENQKASIQEYAEGHGFVVVQTYTDAGKSGVVLKCRAGLSQLLQDVVSGNIGYKVILVYDISRWGRFQDTDEAAHYEFLCKNSGIPVHYCAEPFANDATLPSSILKTLKRTMAGEYSRELGVKVFDGKSRLVRLGFRVGGQAGYGLRRMMLSAGGKPKQQLHAGEYKGLTTDRITLVPGPKKELQCVRDIYEMVLHKRKTCSEIARDLNRRCVPYVGGRSWSYSSVYGVLTNPKYTGCNTWNRTSQRLHGPHIYLASQHWISKPGAFTSIIDQGTFDRVQTILKKRADKKCNKIPDEKLLKKLKRLLAVKGQLSERIISAKRGVPSTATYHSHFGNFRRIYELVGYRPRVGTFDKSDHRQHTQLIRQELINRLKAMFPQNVTVFRLARKMRLILRLDNQLRVSIVICPTARTSTGKLRWVMIPIPAERVYATLLCRLNSKNDRFHSFYMFPRVDLLTYHRFKENDPWLASGKRLKDLSEFYEVAKRLATAR